MNNNTRSRELAGALGSAESELAQAKSLCEVVQFEKRALETGFLELMKEVEEAQKRCDKSESERHEMQNKLLRWRNTDPRVLAEEERQELHKLADERDANAQHLQQLADDQEKLRQLTSQITSRIAELGQTEDDILTRTDSSVGGLHKQLGQLRDALEVGGLGNNFQLCSSSSSSSFFKK